MIVHVVSILVLTAAIAYAEPWQPERFPIGYWHGPPAEANSPKTWQTVADCNFTFAGPRGGYSVEENLRMLDLCEQAGIEAMVVDGRIDWTMTAADDWRETIGEIVADYGEHPALFGYYIRDEPNHRLFEPLGQIRDELERRDPEHLAYINLFPTYASVAQLGTPTYGDHVERYMQMVRPRVLSYDHYALRRDGSLRPDYYENLQIIREAALRHGAQPWQIVLSMAHLAYRDPTEGEMRWQVYTSLAAGMKGIMYFTYWTEPTWQESGQVAIVGPDGSPARLYPIIRSLNAEVLALGDTLLGLTSTGVFFTGEVPAGGTRLGTDCMVQLPDDAPLMLGLFEDAEGTPHAMVVNRNMAEPVAVTARLLPHVVAVQEVSRETGELEPLALEEHEMALSLRPGGGRLLRLETRFDYPRPPEPVERIDFQFDREGDAEDWGATHSLGPLAVQDGTLSTTVTGRDPHMARTFLRVPPDTYSALRVRMRITGGAATAQVFWTTAEEPSFRDDKYLNFAIEPDGQWHEYTVPVGEHEKWRGQQITALRLDPTVGEAEGQELEIDWIVGE